MLLIVALSLLVFYSIKGCLKYKHILPWKILLGVFILLIILVKLKFDSAVKHSCDKWAYGLHHKLDNSSTSCQFEQPAVCHAELLHGLLDLSVYFDTVKCENQETAPSLLAEYYKTEGPIIGLGVTTQISGD